ncbi:MAG: AAA family ATPase, partial [Caldilineaceae bacterium]
MAENRNRNQNGNRPPGNDNGNFIGRSWFWIVLVILALFGSRLLFNRPTDISSMVGLNEIAQAITDGDVTRVVVQGDIVTAYLSGTEDLRSRKEGDESFLKSMEAFGVTQEQLQDLNIEIQNAPNSGAVFNWLIMLLPMILIFAFFIFIMRQAGGAGQNRAMQFGRSRARRMDNADRPTVTFDDVAGSDEAKQELAEVVEFLREPQKFAALGARIPKGVLMVGSPGTGKTLLAKAVAGEAGVPFFS